ncbi:uncharacterized protein Obp83cd [Drosophila tropicalis]|uniref:uncharacterized protein Obp83cd n=1 Tax=Drosophila tropicalis TaxID=46794 RepID=UPI0035ABA366
MCFYIYFSFFLLFLYLDLYENFWYWTDDLDLCVAILLVRDLFIPLRMRASREQSRQDFECHSFEGEQSILQHCMESHGGLSEENVERLARFTQWSASYEEVPCFTQCYIGEIGIYDPELGFNEEATVKQFGRALYNACRERLASNRGQFESSCDHAYAGFHCIASMENDPFIQIEKLPNVTERAKTVMKECLQQIDESERHRINDYQKFSVVEPIPCYTRCFIAKLRLFDEKTRRWQLAAMRRELGIPLLGAHVNGCNQRRGRNPCSTTYQQFTCYVMAN